MNIKHLIIILLLTLCMTSCVKNEPKVDHEPEAIDYNRLQMRFEQLLEDRDYWDAHDIYINADAEEITYYKQSLEAFVKKLSDETDNNAGLSELKEEFAAFSVFEHTKSRIDEMILYLNELETSNEDYLAGMKLFDDRDFNAAKTSLNKVLEGDINHQDALLMIKSMDNREKMWQDAADNDLTGRNPYLNATAYMDGNIYFPHFEDGVYLIVKHNINNDDTFVLPLYKYTGKYIIKGINVVGDYLYFIAGEDIGRGEMYDSPYCIYEMKTDGTGLTMVKSGDYFDLISHKDSFYALSYTQGLVMMDKDFKQEQVIDDKNVIEMYPSSQGLYYTVKHENTFNTKHTIYRYLNREHETIKTDKFLHGYFYDDFTLFYNDGYTNMVENIFIADENFENEKRLKYNIDIIEFHGVLGSKIIYSTAGEMRQNIYTELDIETNIVYSFQEKDLVPDFKILSMIYEEDLMLVKTDDNIVLTDDVENDLTRAIEIPEYDITTLQNNMDILNMNAVDDWYSDEEVVVIRDGLWFYSSPNLNVLVEMVYEEYMETNVFTAYIRCSDPSLFSLGYLELEPPGIQKGNADVIAKINKAVWASNGDFALDSKNKWTGTVLREGKIFKEKQGRDFLAMYPDGRMAVYDKADGITFEELLRDGVMNTLSFGPILVRDYAKTEACMDPKVFISGANPRCAWGMVEPGYYINIIVDGRQPNVSRGMSYYTMSEYFIGLGCELAYNLDGGQTAAGVFMGNYVNTHDNDTRWIGHRKMAEIVYFGQSDMVAFDINSIN